MHNINFIRDNAEIFDQELARRDIAPQSVEILSLDKIIRESKAELQELQQQKNIIAKEIGMLKGKGEDASEVLKKAEQIKQRIAALEGGTEEEKKLHDILSGLPNILFEEVPKGAGEEDNQEIRKWGEPKKFSFEPKQHFELGENLGLIDFEQAAKVSGARFVYLKGQMAKLERALANFMLDIVTNEYGLTEISPPLLVNSGAMYGTSQLPKFAEDAFVTTDGKWLVSTSEIALANMVQGKILAENELPMRLCAYTPCFRSEAGSAGKDTRGMIRLHQFNKVEMVSIVHPDKSVEEHERMTNIAETILQKLNLPYRAMLLCTKDTGFGAKKTHDLEVWLPGQDCYREISSCSNCGDFQARRMKARFKDENKKTNFVHTLNASGLAVGRTLVALIENYQNQDGSIAIPEVLQDYFGGDKIG